MTLELTGVRRSNVLISHVVRKSTRVFVKAWPGPELRCRVSVTGGTSIISW